MEDEKTTVGAEGTEIEDTPKKGDKKAARELLEAQKRIRDLEEALAASEGALAALDDKHLRMAAEYDNFRRRAAQEKSAAYTDGLEGALTRLLPVMDNLGRAAMYREAEKVAEGLALIARAAEEAFAAMGVEAYGAEGEAFDPNLHNAVMHVEDEALGEGVITAVHQKGYRKGERILRYAMVTVAN